MPATRFVRTERADRIGKEAHSISSPGGSAEKQPLGFDAASARVLPSGRKEAQEDPLFVTLAQRHRRLAETAREIATDLDSRNGANRHCMDRCLIS